MSEPYDTLPYGEVQREMSFNAFERLKTLLVDPESIPASGDSVSELPVSVTSSPDNRALTINSELHAYVALFDNIGSVLVEHDRLPDYLRDVLSALIEVGDLKRLEALDVANQVPSSRKYIQEVASERWRAAEAQRMSGEPFNIATIAIPGIGPISVRMEYIVETERWRLGYSFTQQRQYEYLAGHLYRVVDNNLYADPAGSEDDLRNIKDGCYLPSRLDVRLFEEPALI